MDQRTRERIPVLPALLAAVDDGHAAALQRLQAASSTSPGGQFTAAGQTLTRSRTTHASAGKTWAEDPGTGKRRDLTLEEHQAFWAWAAVHILRDTGIFSRGAKRTSGAFSCFGCSEVGWPSVVGATGVVEPRVGCCRSSVSALACAGVELGHQLAVGCPCCR
jgi:hypothetical protein